MAKTHNLFISHSWSYGDSYDRLIALLGERGYFSFKDFSVPKDDPIHTRGTDSELVQAITNKMRLCHCVIIVAGVYSSYSKWIKKELKIAREGFLLPKPVIAIEPWGAVRTSADAKDNADLIVGWNTESIVSAIRELCP